MEAREIRIGNQTSLGVVTGIYEGNGYMVQINNHSAYPIEKVEPIPLTEEWLVKFGFEKDGLIFCFRNKNLIFNILLEDDILTEEGLIFGRVAFIFQNRDNNDQSTNHTDAIELNIMFVHQLQNLYFALTGTELTIKETATA